MLPISLAFEAGDSTTDQINMAVDICFVLDIILVFRTTILDIESGEEVKNAKIIKENYLRGRFTIDFLSTVPFDTVALLFFKKDTAKQF